MWLSSRYRFARPATGSPVRESYADHPSLRRSPRPARRPVEDCRARRRHRHAHDLLVVTVTVDHEPEPGRTGVELRAGRKLRGWCRCESSCPNCTAAGRRTGSPKYVAVNTSRSPAARHVAQPHRSVTAEQAVNDPRSKRTAHHAAAVPMPRDTPALSCTCPSRPRTAPAIVVRSRPSAVDMVSRWEAVRWPCAGTGNDHDNAAAASTGVSHSQVLPSVAPVAIALRTVFTPPAADFARIERSRPECRRVV